jgi:hypothetical protein
LAADRANRLYLFHQYVNIDPTEQPPDLNADWDVSSVGLLAEAAKDPFFLNRSAAEIVTAMEAWFIATRNANGASFTALTSSELNPVVVNVEAFGTVFGDAIENLDQALSNVRAAIGIIQSLRQTATQTGMYRPIGAYITIPKARFFEAYGIKSVGSDGYIANFYEKVNSATIELLSQHVDFFVLDGYVPWAGVPGTLLNQLFPGPASEEQKLFEYLRRSKPAKTHPHYRYPRFVRLGPGEDYSEFPLASRGVGFWPVSDWTLHTIRFLRYQMQLVNRFSRGQPVMIWTSSTFLPNGNKYNDLITPPTPLLEPVWDLLMEEDDFRRYMRELIALNPWAIVLLEGFSQEKLRAFEQIGAFATNPASPWPPGLGPRRGGMRWGEVEGDSIPWAHPYLQKMIEEFKPSSPSP